MRGSNRISDAQYALLRDVRDGNVLLADLKVKHKLDDRRLARWMRGKGFKRGLRMVLRESMERRYVELQLLANVAVACVAAAVREGKAVPWEWLMMYERIVEQARKERQVRDAERRSRERDRARRAKGGRKRVDPDADLCHPDAKAREEELLAILEGGGPA